MGVAGDKGDMAADESGDVDGSDDDDDDDMRPSSDDDDMGSCSSHLVYS